MYDQGTTPLFFLIAKPAHDPHFSIVEIRIIIYCGESVRGVIPYLMPTPSTFYLPGVLSDNVVFLSKIQQTGV
jgi:hypothetical protein